MPITLYIILLNYLIFVLSRIGGSATDRYKVEIRQTMVINLSEKNSLVNNWISEIRDVNVQTDRMRFRRNLERIGEVAAYEISKTLKFEDREVQTPLGTSVCRVMADQPVLGTILRAGVPLHHGMLNYFDQADNAFISAYRKHHRDGSFEISLEYISCPDLTDRSTVLST